MVTYNSISPHLAHYTNYFSYNARKGQYHFVSTTDAERKGKCSSRGTRWFTLMPLILNDDAGFVGRSETCWSRGGRVTGGISNFSMPKFVWFFGEKYHENATRIAAVDFHCIFANFFVLLANSAANLASSSSSSSSSSWNQCHTFLPLQYLWLWLED